MNKFVIGIDYGSDSVRAVVVDAITGKEETSAVSYYKRWSAGQYCNPDKNQFRQHPLDYLESLVEAVQEALQEVPLFVRENIVGIGIDTTGSTPCAVNKDGLPLALTSGFEENPNAMFVLWKDHTSLKEAEEINALAHDGKGIDFTKYEGGIYSSEWFWAKILHVLREDTSVREAAYSWVEHCDWIPAILTGNQEPQKLKRSRCAAGHKAMWHPEWQGLPSEEFLIKLDPLLKGLRERLYVETYTSEVKVGDLTPDWAEKLGLKSGIAVAVGAFDAHMGAVGGGITEKTLVKIMGTSTCDIMIASAEALGNKLVPGICGQVDGSVIPGMIGLEAGQSAFGDVYAWFKNILAWPLENLLKTSNLIDQSLAEGLTEEIKSKIISKLSIEAAEIESEETGLVALDWLNGRRTPDADQALKGALIGLSLGTTAPKIFRSLVEATAFGAKAIVDRFINEGIAIEQVIALGGIAKKSDFVMQITADVLNMPIKVAVSEQACALGAGMFGAVAGGLYETISEAQQKMSSGFSKAYLPQPENVFKYQSIYQKYLSLGQSLSEELKKL